MDDETSEPIMKTCQNQEWHISQIDGYLKMLTEIAARTSFSSTANLAETKFKRLP